MARLFDDTAGDYLEIDQAVLSTTPITMACWVRPDEISTWMTPMWIGDKDASDEYHEILLDTSDKVRAQTSTSGGTGIAQTTTTFSQNTWHHVCGVWASSTDRRAFLDGSGKGTNATNLTPSGLDRTSIGRRGGSTPGVYMSGRIAEAAIWNVALTDDEVYQLSRGFSPLLVRPDKLVAYWQLVGRDCPEPDVAGGYDMTPGGLTDTGWVAVGTGASDSSEGTEAWSNPGNITADDGSYAETGSVGWSNNEITEFLKGTNLGLSVPSTADIAGIEARIEAKSSWTSGDDKTYRMSLVKGGAIQSYDAESSEQNIPNSWGFISYGGASDLWDNTWTVADVNASDFGAAFQAVKRGGSTVATWVDVMQLKVHYADGPVHADHPEQIRYPFQMTTNPKICDGINGALIGHLATLGVGR